MNGYFEGNYRRTREQNLSGAGRKDNVNNLISRVQDQRKRRERERLILEKSITLQSIYRGHKCRQFWNRIFKNEFEKKINELDPDKLIPLNDLCFLLQRLKFFFPSKYEFNSKRIPAASQKENVNYIIAVIKLMQKMRVKIIAAMGMDMNWAWRTKSFLMMNVSLLKHLPADVEELAVPTILQFLIYFTDVPLYKQMFHDSRFQKLRTIVWRGVIRHQFFSSLLKILSLKSKFTPTTYKIILSAVVLIFKNSFDYVQLDDMSLSGDIIQNFVFEIMEKPQQLIVRNEILPSLLNLENFPLVQVGKYLYYRRKTSPYTLYRFLCADREMAAVSAKDMDLYFKILSNILHVLHYLRPDEKRFDQPPKHPLYSVLPEEYKVLQSALCGILYSKSRTDIWLSYTRSSLFFFNHDVFRTFVECLYLVWLPEQPSVYENRLYNTILFYPGFLDKLWGTLNEKMYLLNIKPDVMGSPISLLINKDANLIGAANTVVPLVTMFCFFFLNHIITLQEDMFYKDEDHDGPGYKAFNINTIRDITRCLKECAIAVLSLVYPKSEVEFDIIKRSPRINDSKFNCTSWKSLLKMLNQVLLVLYNRDCRRKFMEDGFWHKSGPDSNEECHSYTVLKEVLSFCPCLGYVYGNKYTLLLNTMPYLLNLKRRMITFRNFVNEMKENFQDPGVHFLQTPHLLIQIRRQYLYEDAFNQLNRDTAPEVRIHVRVHMVNTFGLEEAGIDGGGLFREFIIELLKTAFDPNRGFFLCNSDNELYPNPNVHLVQPQFEKHYAFIGRMLGKAIYEKVLVEIPLAEFFLSRIVNDRSDLPINDLASFDPDMHRHLISLLSYKGSFADLGLDFTLSIDCFGSNKIISLKPDGANIPVTEENVLEYVQLVSYYKIHEQISEHMNAFIHGLRSIIRSSWLSMFTAKEFQLIISGTESPFDVSDLRKCAIYTGVYNDDHPTIQMFWRVFSNFTRAQKCQLLRFVTSCSRPPLLGFKELVPPFCVQYVADVDLLPTSSTCTNVLKLPNFQDEETMRERLLYAINSASGFELM